MMRSHVCVLLAIHIGFAAGCRSMPIEARPVETTRTFHAATRLDENPHVLTITTFKPPVPPTYRTPQNVMASAVGSTLYCELQDLAKKGFDRHLGYHIFGHVIVELKTVDPATNEPVYLVTAVTDADYGEAWRLLFKEKVGLTLLVTGTAGKVQTPDEAATILDEPAEIGVAASRMRFLLSPESAAAMLAHYRDFVGSGVYKRFSLTAYPLDRNGAGCTSFGVSFLDAGGVLTPEMIRAWRVSLTAPEHLFGDPAAGRKVPMWKVLTYFATHRRWPETDCKTVRFYDTGLMYRYAADLAERTRTEQPETERKLAEYLAIPTVTFDARTCVPRPAAIGVSSVGGELRDQTGDRPEHLSRRPVD
jgi:hypothetical protein